MIHLINVNISFSGQDVLKNVSWHIGPKDVIGLVGNNGSGKTTLMKLIAGLQESDDGEITSAKTVTFGYLPQDGVVHAGETLFNEAASVYTSLIAMQEEESKLLKKMESLDSSSEEYEKVAYRYGEIHDQLLVEDAYNLEQKVETVLAGLGFSHDDMQRRCDEFSGGWQMRIALAKVLLSRPNLLLLDEPTNYLDIEAREFLEEWLKGYAHSILLVSHDRHFLDQVVNRITEINGGHLTDYHCNYTRYLDEREERLERLRAQARRVEEERQRIQAFIDRFRYKADKASMVQSRVKQLEKLDKIELPPVRKKIKFAFPQPDRSGKIAIEANRLTAGYGDGPDVLKDISFQTARGEKVALVGVNGAGKSTLMKVLAGGLAPRSGEINFGYNVSYDYFAQDVHTQLDMNTTVYDTLKQPCPFELVPKLRNLLGAFLFSGDEVDKKVMVLSGGERNRLVLARMLLVPSNVLLLDEPTNHLDIDAKDVLLDALSRFEGTVLFVSHDRYFLDRLATKVYALNHGELSIYPGSYPEFLADQKRRNVEENANSEEAIADRKNSDRQALAKAERVARYEEEKQRKRERERLAKLVERLEADVESGEAKIQALIQQMAKPEYSTNFAELEKLADEKDQLEKDVHKLTTQWEDAADQLEELLD